MGTLRCTGVRRDKGRAEEKETDGQRWKHKLTRRKQINSRHGADLSTYAAPRTAKHGEAPAVPITLSPRGGPAAPGGWQWELGKGVVEGKTKAEADAAPGAGAAAAGDC